MQSGIHKEATPKSPVKTKKVHGKYACGQCHQKFSSYSLSKIHEDFHTNTKTFKCDKCEKHFKVKTKLKRHVLAVHEGIKEFKCEICDKAFSQKSHKNSHMENVHEGIRNFYCDLCENKSFVKSIDLRNHMKNYHGMES